VSIHRSLPLLHERKKREKIEVKQRKRKKGKRRIIDLVTCVYKWTAAGIETRISSGREGRNHGLSNTKLSPASNAALTCTLIRGS
jgi:hypothetical protein